MLEYVRPQWQDGERRLRDLEPATRRPVERAVAALVAELRRRLGSRFTAEELAELYDGSQRWTMGIAVQAAPNEPVAWEQWVADAAFNLYVRDASDWPLPVGVGVRAVRAVPPRPPLSGRPAGAPPEA